MIVYKYRPVDKYTLELLINNEFHLSYPEDFNDPFDCHIVPFYKGTEEQIISYIKNQNRPKEEENDILKRLEKNNYDFMASVDNTRYNSQRSLLVYCFSKVKKNILLWSHYCRAHTGIAMGFNTISKGGAECIEFEENVTFVDSLDHSLKKFNNLKEVVYEKFLDTYNAIEDYDLMNFYKYFFYKAKEWKYEEECRLLFHLGDLKQNDIIKRKVKFDKKILKEVIFGLRTSEEDKKTIRSIIKDKGYDVKYFQCERKTDEYGLNIVPA